MKYVFKWMLVMTGLATLIGCASSGMIKSAGPITLRKPFELDVVWVETSSSIGGLDTEQRQLNDLIISGLKERQLFTSVSGNKAEVSPGSGIKVTAEIKEIRKISDNTRLWAGALAGRARILVQVTVSDLNSGNQIEVFDAEGKSSGGSALAGITDEAIQAAADQIVLEVVKINARAAKSE